MKRIANQNCRASFQTAANSTKWVYKIYFVNFRLVWREKQDNISVCVCINNGKTDIKIFFWIYSQLLQLLRRSFLSYTISKYLPLF
jgi:hypothetical protein